ncbi:MAG: glycosyltransferase [Limnohabitans sp.]
MSKNNIKSFKQNFNEEENSFIKLIYTTANELEDDIENIKFKNSKLIKLIQSIQINENQFIRNENIIQSESARLREYILFREKEVTQLSDWANNINEYPIGYAIRKYTYKFSKRILRILPLSQIQKRKLANATRNYTRPIRALLGSNNAKIVPNTFLTSIKSELVSMPHHERNIFVFGVIDWHFRIQRPQQIASCLSRLGWRVFYFSNNFIDESEPGFKIEKIDSEGNIYQVNLNVLNSPQIYFSGPKFNDLVMLKDSARKFITDLNLKPSVIMLQHAYWECMLNLMPNALRIYDCMDHHEGFDNVPIEILELEEKVINRVDSVIVTSNFLQNFIGKKNSNVTIIRNACDFFHFNSVPDNVYTDPLQRKIIGYFGAIAEWFDLDLVRAVAEKFKDCLILLIGNDTINASSEFNNLDNVVFTGEVSYNNLPYYLHSFDVCLLPFKVMPLTLATNPVKVYEYLAAGKPVVSVDLPEVSSQFGDLVYTAKNHAEFLEYLELTLFKDLNSKKSIKLKQDFAAIQTWRNRASAFNDYIDVLTLPKISVIVLTYNNLELTKACLLSILEKSNYTNFELIIVDNASTDGSIGWLREFKKNNNNIELIENRTNVGFSAGNNIGLTAATGEYIVILNNDTIVTHNWLITLMHHLKDDPTIGLIGPVTNNIGNEAKINITYNNISEMHFISEFYTRENIGKTYPLRTAAFFCVMMHRSTFQKVGLLDEAFGRGFFEDDDYCRRIENIGLKIVCAEDVFIHHHLSASFNKIKQTEREDLFNKNLSYYESKWGTWIPHTYRN